MSLALDQAPIKPIIFFDGYCVLCNGSVNFVLKRDKKHKFFFASLQGETAHRLLSEKVALGALESVVLFENGRIWQRSDAAIRICAVLGGFYKIALVLKVIPRSVRDFVYDWVARNRYRWFGRRDACRVPTPESKDYMLD